MKKSIKKSSRRKWVVGGVAFFGSIALLTTGFATWVVGVQNTTDEGEVTVTVETTENNYVNLEMKLSDSAITLGETSSIAAGAGVIVSTSQTVGGDLAIKFSEITIEIGDNVSSKYDTIEFSIVSENNLVEEGSFGTEIRPASESGWTYLTAPTSIKFKEGGTFTLAEDGAPNTKKYKLTASDGLGVSFTWGSFFGNVSPATFYNNNYESLSKNLSDSIQKINKEMSDMSADFASPNNVLKLQAKLVDSTAPKN